MWQDSNLGLVKQVVSSLYKRNIQRLTQTFVTLSLQDIADTVQLESSKEAELYILRMVYIISTEWIFWVKNLIGLYFYSIHCFQIQEGEIFATINQKDGMVCFHEDPEQYKTSEVSQNLDVKMRKWV